jgi:autotransporter-associated beta strand protein
MVCHHASLIEQIETMKSVNRAVQALNVWAFLALSIPLQAIDYFYNGIGPVTEVASWFTNRNGTGTNPANFTTDGNAFIVQNGQTALLSGTWAISGTGSGLLVETGGVFQTGANNPSLTLNMQSGATFLVENSTYSNLSLGVINSESNFELANTTAPRISGLTYGNLIFSGSNAFSFTTNLNATGNLIVNDSGQVRLTNSSNVTHAVAGGFTIASGSSVSLTNGVGNMSLNLSGSLTNSGTLVKGGAGSAELNFTGSTAATATWGAVTTSNFSNFTINVASGKNLTFADSLNAGAATVNVNGTLNLGAQVLSGASGNFNLASGATLISSHANGLDGAVTMTGTRTFSTGANYEFRGATTGSLLPSTVHHLTINRDSGMVALDGSGTSQTVSGTLNLVSGGLMAGSSKNSMTVGSLVMRNTEISSNLNTTLQGNVTFDATNQGRAKISGALDLGGATRTFTVGNGTSLVDMEVTGGISSGGVIKDGLGTMSIAGVNDYAGTTTVSAGTLYVSGTLSHSAVDVGANGRIGTGGGVGMLGAGLTMSSGAAFDLTGATIGVSSTGILGVSGGELTLSKLTFQDVIGWDWRNAGLGTYQLIAGDFEINWGETEFLSRETAYDFGNGFQGYFTSGSLNVVIVPEPSLPLLASSGGLVWMRRRREK